MAPGRGFYFSEKREMGLNRNEGYHERTMSSQSIRVPVCCVAMASSSALISSHIACRLRVLSDVRGSERVRRSRACLPPLNASTSEASICDFSEDERRTRGVGISSPRDVNRRSVLTAPVGVLAALACVPLAGRAAELDEAQAVDTLAPQVPARKCVLVLGATGRVGSATVLSLLHAGHDVRAIVRNASSLPTSFLPFTEPRGPGDEVTGRLVPIESSVSSMSIPAMADAMRGCDAVVQCLGHRLTLDGLYGEPRFLCRDAAALVFDAWDTVQEFTDDLPMVVNYEDEKTTGDSAMVAGPDTRWSMPVAGARKPKRFILLASAGADNPAGTDPTRPFAERAFIEALAKILPPFADTLAEVDLVSGKDGAGASSLQWTVVRPDDFLDETTTPTETGWVLHERLQNGLFDAGLSSVVNIGACMAALAVGDEATWREWAGKMPQVLDDPQPSKA